jgi:hypothetical protein
MPTATVEDFLGVLMDDMLVNAFSARPGESVDWATPGQANPVVPEWAGIEGLAERLALPGDLGVPGDGPAPPALAGNIQGDAKRFIELASQYVGVPYVWGGTSAKGLDCSGLIQLAASQMGVKVPRVSRDQARVGVQINSLADAQPGDLIAFPGRGQAVGHIGIYMGGGKMLHAPRTGRNVVIEDIGNRKIATIRRLFQGEPSGSSA